MLDGHPDARSRTDAAIPVSRGHLLPTAFGLALLAMPLMARAQARPTAHLLVVRSPEVMGCPSDDELREQVAARLGRDPFAPEEGEVRAEVRLGRAGRVHVARVLVSAGDTLGERSLRDRDCGELVEAVAVVLAVLLTDASTPPPPTSIEEGTADAPEEVPLVVESVGDPPAVTPPVDQPPSATGAASPQVVPRPHPLGLELDIAGGVLFGWLPGPSALLRVGIALRAAEWSISLDGRVALDASVGEAPRTGAIGWAGGTAAGCGHIDFVGLCGTVTLARSSGVGTGVSNPAADEALVLGVGASVRATWSALDWLRLWAEAAFDVPLIVPEAWIDGSLLWRGSPAAGVAQLGASARLGSMK